MDRNISDIESLKKRMDNQQRKLDSMWGLISENRKVEQIADENYVLKQLVAEKESVIKVLKDKLAEKARALRDVEDKLKQLEVDLSERDRIIEKMNAANTKNMESFRANSEEAKKLLMVGHSKKVTVMSAAIDMLKTKIEQQNRMIRSQIEKEGRLIEDFSRAMREALSAKSALVVDTRGIATGTFEEEKTETKDKVDVAKVDLLTGSAPEAIASAEVKSSKESRVNEIVPIIELALDHGDTLDNIRHSILSAGYAAEDFDKAVSGMNIVQR